MKYLINKTKLDTSLKMYNDFEVDLYYPVKVNSNEVLLSLINDNVKGFETDSLSQIAFLVRQQHIEPSRIIFSYPLKQREDIQAAAELGVTRFVVDNIAECQFITESQSSFNASILIRISIADIVSSYSRFYFKWGASIEDAKIMKKMIQSSSCTFAGYSFYLPEEVNHIENFEKMVSAISEGLGFADCRFLDIGGGVDVDVLHHLLPMIKRLIGNGQTKIMIEPGRHLVNPCIDMLAKVLSIRRYDGIKTAFLDTGIYNGLLDAVIKGRHFGIEPDCRDVTDEDEVDFSNYVICGKSSDISDIIGQYLLPSKLKIGDNVRIFGCGAYCDVLETKFYKDNDTPYEIV